MVVSWKNDWKADIFCSKTEDQQNNFLPLILEAEDDPIVQETSGGLHYVRFLFLQQHVQEEVTAEQELQSKLFLHNRSGLTNPHKLLD